MKGSHWTVFGAGRYSFCKGSGRIAPIKVDLESHEFTQRVIDGRTSHETHLYTILEQRGEARFVCWSYEVHFAHYCAHRVSIWRQIDALWTQLAVVQWVDRGKISIFWIYKLELKEAFFAVSASREPKMDRLHPAMLIVALVVDTTTHAHHRPTKRPP